MIRVVSLLGSILAVMMPAVSLNSDALAQDSRRYIIKFKESRARALTRSSAKALDLKISSLGDLSARVIDKMPADHSAVIALDRNELASIESRRDVESVEPDTIVKAFFDPNDPVYSLQYSLNGEYGSRVSAAWDITTGSRRAVVAIIDTGADLAHPDIQSNLWINSKESKGTRGRDDDGNGCVDDIHGCDLFNSDGSPQDDNGHGTHVAGIVAASGNNAIGVTGAAWGSRILSVKALGADGSGVTSTIAKAIDYVTTLKSKGAPIVAINLSLGGGGYSNAIYRAVERARNHDILVVAAAGNSGSNNDVAPLYPANLTIDSVVSVAATDAVGNLASYSNYGAATVHIAAPGSQIWSTALRSLGYQYRTLSGTSMSSPLAAGVISLISAANPALSMLQVKSILLTTGRPLDSLRATVITGALVDAQSAVRAAASTPALVRVAGFVRNRARAVSGATVTLTLRGGATPLSRVVTTASDGSYSFSELPKGDYTLKVKKVRLRFASQVISATALKTFRRDFSAQ